MTDVKRGRARLVQLLSSGEDLLFVHEIETDRRDRSQRAILLTGRKSERITFSRGPSEPLLAVEEVDARMGVLRTDADEFKLRAEDATQKTVQLKIGKLLDRWKPESRKALHHLTTVIAACRIDFTSRGILEILFPNVDRGAKATTPCAVEVARVPPDPQRDRKFVVLMPELSEILKSPVTLLEGGERKPTP